MIRSSVAGAHSGGHFSKSRLAEHLPGASCMARFSKLQSGALGGATPDSFTPESRESAIPANAAVWGIRKIKELEHVQPNSRRPRRALHFFATFSCKFMVLSEYKYWLKMLVQLD